MSLTAWLSYPHGCFHHPGLRRLPGPPRELPFGLRDEHRETIERQASRLPRLAQQRTFLVAVRQVVDQLSGERSARQRALVARARTAKRRAVDQEVPRTSRRWPGADRRPGDLGDFIRLLAPPRR